MQLKINIELLSEQIRMCDIHADNASSEEERNIFTGIANLLDNIGYAVEKRAEIIFIEE